MVRHVVADLTTAGLYLEAAAFGFVSGASEVFVRYADAPRRLVRLKATWVYALASAAISALAYLVMSALGWHLTGLHGAADPATAAVAGLGGVMLLRSAFAVVVVNGEDVRVGPVAALERLL